MKIYLLITSVFLFALIIHAKKTNDLNGLISYIKSADFDTLDNDLKFIAKSLDAKILDHYCCNIDDRILVIENRTRTASYSSVETQQHIIGYQVGSCLPSIGVFPTGVTFAPCHYPIYQNYTVQIVRYRIEHYSVPVETHHCPEEHVVCCDGYTMLNGHCTDSEYAAQLQALIDLGLIQIGIGK